MEVIYFTRSNIFWRNCFYIKNQGGIKKITSIPIQVFCFILSSIVFTWWKNILFYTTFILTILKKVPIWACPSLPLHYLRLRSWQKSILFWLMRSFKIKEKLQKYQPYHQAKIINMNILQVKKYWPLIKKK